MFFCYNLVIKAHSTRTQEYTVSRKYCQCFTCSTFCDVIAKMGLIHFHLKTLHTPQNNTMTKWKTWNSYTLIKKKRKTKIEHVDKYL